MRAFFLLLTLTTPLAAQTPLHEQIAEIAKDAKGTVYVACSLPGTQLECDLNEHGHPPMQSTFKFPLAMAVLHMIELGKLQLDQPIRFLKSDRSSPTAPYRTSSPKPTSTFRFANSSSFRSKPSTTPQQILSFD
jgi:beta-lactamase class A